MTRSKIAGAIRHSTLYVLTAALAAGFGLWSAQRWFAPPPPPPLLTVTLFPATRAVDPFVLRSGENGTLTPASLRGHWTLVYLGYTHCPDVCPTTLQMLGQAEKSWASLPAAARPRIWFVSVDPQRDSPVQTAEYAHYFGKDIVGATADDKTLAALAHDLGLVYLIDKSADGKTYTVDHSAGVALLDPNGHMAGLIRPAPPPAQPFDPQAIGADLIALTAFTAH